MEKLDCFNEFNKVINTIPVGGTFQPPDIQNRIKWQTNYKLNRMMQQSQDTYGRDAS